MLAAANRHRYACECNVREDGVAEYRARETSPSMRDRAAGRSPRRAAARSSWSARAAGRTTACRTRSTDARRRLAMPSTNRDDSRTAWKTSAGVHSVSVGQRGVDVVAVQRDQAQHQVGDAADLREEVVGEAALAVAVGDEVEVALVEEHEHAAREQQRPVRPLAAQDLAPRRPLAAAQLAQQQRRGQRDCRFAGRDRQHEKQRRQEVRAAEVREHRAEVERRHQRGRAAADVGDGFGRGGMEREQQRRDQCGPAVPEERFADEKKQEPRSEHATRC